MQKDFHYYATFCAGLIAGYTPEESRVICIGAQMVDVCSRTLLSRIKAPLSAATTQLQLELMEKNTDIVGLQDITRIWASFHFLPKDLAAEPPVRSTKKYKKKYRLICGPDGSLVKDTVELAKGSSLEAAGIAMHVLSDTWAHMYFAGTPSLVINNVNKHFYELIGDGGCETERQVRFRYSPSGNDNPDTGLYNVSMPQPSENSVFNLGHARAGHLPDYSYAKYRYLPAWGNYEEIIKDNPSDYFNAFCQMVAALRYLRGGAESFETGVYDTESVRPYAERIMEIIRKRQIDASGDWKALGEELAPGFALDDFDVEKYACEYVTAEDVGKDDTFFGRFTVAALAQKSMVTNKIFRSGNLLAGFSVDYDEKGFKGIKDYIKLIEVAVEERRKNNG